MTLATLYDLMLLSNGHNKPTYANQKLMSAGYATVIGMDTMQFTLTDKGRDLLKQIERFVKNVS